MMEQKNPYFSANRAANAYRELAGKEINKSVHQLLLCVEDYINQAYEDGYAAGLEAKHE